jgi:medium-chain acyl-[acyl-carrier-protein] hydrolase
VITSWLTCTKPVPDSSARLFCFPYAGAGASIFRSWSANLPNNLEVFAVQLPGREKRFKEPLFNDIASLIEALIPALLPYLDRPFVFFGHSVGALISFEVARQLHGSDYPTPLHLFVSGRRAPHWPAAYPSIHQLPDPEFLEELGRYNGTPEQVLQCTELMNLFLPILRADLTIDETYHYQHSQNLLSCRVSAFGGSEDDRVNYDALAAWREQTCGDFRLRLFPGDHFYLKPQQKELLQAIAEDLLLLL